MELLSRSFQHFVLAYKHQSDKEVLINNLNAAIREMEIARETLFSTQHDVFKTWYAEDRLFSFDILLDNFHKVKGHKIVNRPDYSC